LLVERTLLVECCFCHGNPYWKLIINTMKQYLNITCVLLSSADSLRDPTFIPASSDPYNRIIGDQDNQRPDNCSSTLFAILQSCIGSRSYEWTGSG
jgi:hypothetical protein